MRIPLDRETKLPLYQQIESHLRQSILSGSLATGTRLPATRQLARDLGISRITAETAYAELEADGLIAMRAGSGTFVLPPHALPQPQRDGRSAAWPLWQQDVQAESRIFPDAPPNGISSAVQHPNLIDFAGGSGDPLLFPVKDFRKAMQQVIRRDGIAAFGYGELSGYAPLRETIAHILASQGFQVPSANILVTAGSQRALSLVAELLLKTGDAVLLEGPTYAGALDLFRVLGARIVAIPIDERGMQVEKAEKLLQQHHPKLIYTIPNFQNPSGTCLSGQRRRQLISLADRYNVPILEDDFVGDLRYDGRALPALKELDPGGRVIYVSTFSKMLMPGLRVGFVVAEGPIYDRLLRRKHVYDLETSNLMQRALEAYVTVGRYQAHLRRSCRVYRKRRDAMLSAIERQLPVGVQVEPPQGGLFMWLHLPDGLSSEELIPLAYEEGVTFAPGQAFFPNGSDGQGSIRLNFVMQPPEVLEEGVKRMGRAMLRLAARG